MSSSPARPVSSAGPRSFRGAEFPPESLRDREPSVSVCVPALDEARTIGPIVETLAGLRRAGAIDEVVVVAGPSRDGTAELAAELGASVHRQDRLMPELGPVLGKGDAIWRALSVLRGDVVCFLDADTEGLTPEFACGLVGPLIADPGLQLVKAAYRRPLRVGGVSLPDEGGRVTELTARPLLAAFYPPLAGFEQPLAGQFAVRRGLLESLPLATGYGVEIALLIDAYLAAGLGALAQSDVGTMLHRHRPLPALGRTADEVLAAVVARLQREGRMSDGAVGRGAAPLVERPPFASLRRAA